VLSYVLSEYGHVNTTDHYYGDPGAGNITDKFHPVLAAEFETFNDVMVAGFVLGLHIVEQATTGTYHLQQSIAGAVILLVEFQVLGEFLYSTCQHRNLYLGRTSVRGMSPEFFLNCALNLRIHTVFEPYSLSLSLRFLIIC